MWFGVSTLSKHCFCDITCTATRRQMTQSSSVELISSLEDAPGKLVQVLLLGHRKVLPVKQASSSKGYTLALLQRCMREGREHRASGQEQVQSFVSYVDPSTGSWKSTIFPGLESEQTFSGLCSMLKPAKGMYK